MKLIFALTATLIAFSAQANDRKIGNVIAVERQITNIYDSCLSKVSGDTSKDQDFFICTINFLKTPTEMAITKGGLIRLVDSNCKVYGDAANGALLITFGKAQGLSDFAAAKNCLAQATLKPVNVNVYTVE
ncbi:hypothetical protein CIK05_01640 [Bdellovibrio sp. qaytius]|nr:hypothetical protein CIK05_01640 [Bdellovibrio sp. qaytius]